MLRRDCLLAIFSAAALGCKSLSSRADRGIVAKFDQVDSVKVVENRTPLFSVDDPDAISKLKSIYRNATWKPWIDTMPIGGRWLRCKRSGEVLFELLFVGWLIECDETGGPIRKATLDEASRKWLRELTRGNDAPE